jgi:hypothetical protein
MGESTECNSYYLDHALKVYIIGNYNYTVSLSHVFSRGAGLFEIQGKSEDITKNSLKNIQLYNVHSLDVVGCTFSGNGVIATQSVEVRQSTGIRFTRVRSLRGFFFEYSRAMIKGSEINTDKYSSTTCIIARHLSKILSFDNTGIGETGLGAYEGSTIIKYQNQPTGTRNNEYIYAGGVIR